MLIKNVRFEGYGPFQDIKMPLWSEDNIDRKVTVLIGENGAGKSAFLEGIVTLLSCFVARVQNDKSDNFYIDTLKINNKFSALTIQLEVDSKGMSTVWTLSKTTETTQKKGRSNLKDISALAQSYAKNIVINDSSSLPLIAYYPAERYVLNFPLDFDASHTYKQIDGYADVLGNFVDFDSLFWWFRYREDIQNEMKIGLHEIINYIDYAKFSNSYGKSKKDEEEASLDEIFSFLDKEKLKLKNPALFAKVLNREQSFFDPQFMAVTRAITNFMPNYTNLRIERRPRMRMLIDKDGQPFDILQLSQGERSLLALVGDIARRLAIMNPALDDPLQGEGIVLIDEVDLHLHPRWQRSIVRNLRNTFPNCQFILTTHSPLVISDPDNVQVLALRDGTIEELPNLYGMDVEQVFLEVMGTPLRDEELQEKIDDLLDAIQDKDFSTAKKLRQELSKILPPDHRELVRADIFLRRQEAIHAKDK